jgi:hypothetical protein
LRDTKGTAPNFADEPAGVRSIAINNASFEADTIPNNPGFIRQTPAQWTSFNGATIRHGVLTARADSGLAACGWRRRQKS